MIDHMSFSVKDLAASRNFYVQALEPLNIGVAVEGEGWVVLDTKVCQSSALALPAC